uniref:SRPBCC domain-containing protein n=1 Tax=Brevibacterium renqingii TaxID=2776916 RepID=UPI001AE0800E|nr:SRPBCC domain-containing protein [Brevibacterium renqingii]
MVYEHDDFRTGGSFLARCGTPGELEFASVGQYSAIEPGRYVVSSETVSHSNSVLSAALITWTLEAMPTGTRVSIVDQVASFVGQGMIDGHKNGHEVCLRQLGSFLSR